MDDRPGAVAVVERTSILWKDVNDDWLPRFEWAGTNFVTIGTGRAARDDTRYVRITEFQ